MADGDRFSYGGYTFQAILTPGHTPGHMVLWEEAHGILLLGDHVLFDITPNITVWPSYANPLGGYLDSLALVRRLPVRLPLPAHRTVQTGLQERIDEIIAHHSRRCGEVADSALHHPRPHRLRPHRPDDLGHPLPGAGRTSRCPRSGSP